MIRRVSIFLLGGKWRYIYGHLQWEMYLIRSTPILLEMDPKTFQRIRGGSTRSSSAPIFASPWNVIGIDHECSDHESWSIPIKLVLSMLISKLMSLMPCYITLIPQCMLTQPISVITKLSSCYYHIVMLYHIDTTMYVDSTHFCHHKVVIMLSSYCHHIVFDVLMLYIISATTELHHIAIVLSSYCY